MFSQVRRADSSLPLMALTEHRERFCRRDAAAAMPTLIRSLAAGNVKGVSDTIVVKWPRC